MTREIAKQLINVIKFGIVEKQHGIAKHWELIKKFADGARIQVESYNGWVETGDPDFDEDCHYRVKPEPPRWRADCGETYWCVKQYASFPCFVNEITDNRTELSNRSYEMGNYFKHKEEAQMVANLINKIFALVRDGVPASDIKF